MDDKFDFANEVYFLKEAIELEVAYQQLMAATGIWHATLDSDFALRATYEQNPLLFHNVCKDFIGWSPVSDDHLYFDDFRDRETREELEIRDMDNEWARHLDDDRWYLDGDWRDYL
jgi:hypothetical protein